jgi:CheY-like chemotaxis protein
MVILAFLTEGMSKTIVIIDDDSDDLEIMKEALAQVDDSLMCFSFVYPEEAIQLLSNELILLPDFIFIDINIPRLSGDKCLVHLRAIPEFRDVPIIMYSTSMPPTVAETLRNYGATYSFQKPFALQEYVNILQRIIFGGASHA